MRKNLRRCFLSAGIGQERACEALGEDALLRLAYPKAKGPRLKPHGPWALLHGPEGPCSLRDPGVIGLKPFTPPARPAWAGWRRPGARAAGRPSARRSA